MQVFEQFLASQPGWTAITRSLYRAWLERLQRFCSSSKIDWTSAQRGDLERFRQHLLWTAQSRGGLFSPNTVYQGLRVLRAFYAWAKRAGLILENPIADWILPRPYESPPLLLTRAEFQALLNRPDLSTPGGLRDQLLLHLIASAQLSLTSCRLLELTHLQHGQIAWQDRFIPLDDGLHTALHSYLQKGRPALEREPQTHLLLTQRGRPYATHEGLRYRLNHYARQLGWKNLDARTLHRSARAHSLELSQRHPADTLYGRFT